MFFFHRLICLQMGSNHISFKPTLALANHCSTERCWKPLLRISYDSMWLSRSFRGSCSSLCLPDAISWRQLLFSSDNHWCCFGCASFQECGASSFVFAQNIFGWCCNVPDALRRPWRPATALTSCMTFATSLSPLPSVIDFGAPAFWLCFGFRRVFAGFKLNIWIWKTKNGARDDIIKQSEAKPLQEQMIKTTFNYIK